MSGGRVRTGARRVVDPVADFLRTEAGGGFALLAAAVVALVWINLVSTSGYESFWANELTIGIGEASITEDLRHWVNDGLMALFFFVISLEIKRELVTGDLSEPRAAALPVIAAIGGVVLPALLYLLIAGDGEASRGWGIPMATDAAFAIGVLLLLGDRVATGVKLFLLTIAVVDDVIAICVIAAAYTADLSLPWFAAAVAGLAVVAAMRRFGVSSPLAYVPIALAIWVATLESGVHATIAGVVLALMTPARPVNGRNVLEQLEHRLHPWSAYLVLPLFALANAGVAFGDADLSEGDAGRVALAVAVALVLGKLVGITVATLLALRLRIGELPQAIDLRSIVGVAALGGIGFTVSLFITPLAFDSASLVDGAKVGILAGSVVATAIGTAILALRPRRDP